MTFPEHLAVLSTAPPDPGVAESAGRALVLALILALLVGLLLMLAVFTMVRRARSRRDASGRRRGAAPEPSPWSIAGQRAQPERPPSRGADAHGDDDEGPSPPLRS